MRSCVFRELRLSACEMYIAEKQIEELVKEGIVELCSSENVNPVVVTKKIDDSLCVYIDYQEFNKIIETVRYPVPLIEDEAEQLKYIKIIALLT